MLLMRIWTKFFQGYKIFDIQNQTSTNYLLNFIWKKIQNLIFKDNQITCKQRKRDLYVLGAKFPENFFSVFRLFVSEKVSLTCSTSGNERIHKYCNVNIATTVSNNIRMTITFDQYPKVSSIDRSIDWSMIVGSIVVNQ